MTFGKSIKTFLVLALLATTAPLAADAKPNGYPGESSTFKPLDPEVAAQKEAEKAKRKALRKQRREERKRKRLEKRKNRASN